MASKSLKKAQSYFNKVAALDGIYKESREGRQASNAERKAMRTVWTKRQMGAGSMYKGKNAKPSKVRYV